MMEATIPVGEIMARLPALRDEARLPDECMGSHPIPVDAWGASVEFFFVPWRGRPPEPPVLYPPLHRMVVNLATGKATRVTPARPKDYGLVMDAKEALGEHRFEPPLEVQELLDLQQQLYAALDALLPAFPVMPLDPGEEVRAAAGRFSGLFGRIAHKPLLPFYRATNPQFFEWIRSFSPVAEPAATPDAPTKEGGPGGEGTEKGGT